MFLLMPMLMPMLMVELEGEIEGEIEVIADLSPLAAKLLPVRQLL